MDGRTVGQYFSHNYCIAASVHFDELFTLQVQLMDRSYLCSSTLWLAFWKVDHLVTYLYFINYYFTKLTFLIYQHEVTLR